MHVDVIIHGRELPGLTCTVPEGMPYANIHVGVQRKAEVVDLRPGNAPSVQWTLALDVVTTADGADFKGPFAHGKKGDRFLYLSWGTLDAGTFTMFRRAKLMLAAIDDDVIRAVVGGRPLIAELGLTLPNGTPVCAAVRPPRIRWSAGGG